MPSTANVDLTAILPALKEAVAPFEKAMEPTRRTAINPTTDILHYAPLHKLPIGTLTRLVDAVNAVRRMAGDIK